MSGLEELKILVTEIENNINAFLVDAKKKTQPKSAWQRSRIMTIVLQKQFKQFRNLSIVVDKETKNQKCLDPKIRKREYTNHKLKTDVNFKLAHYLRNRMRNAIHRNQKSGSAVKDLGCSVPELKTYLEAKFQEGMGWENWGEWHIDHIKPLVSFNLQDRGEFLKACHYTNLQPLWKAENLEKNKLSR